MPRYSIIIPTRQRHDTLYYSLLAALALDYDDYEIVVQDNCSDPRTREVVESFQSSKIIYQRSDAVLSMSDNWEMALQATSGDFITYVGDDDALTLDSCRICDRIVERTGSDIVYWSPHNYWWPNAIAEWNRNTLYLNLYPRKLVLQQYDAKALLRDYYRFEAGYENLPMVYNAFISRTVVNKVIDKVGSYFARAVPDLYSGIAHCSVVDTILFVRRSLSIRGISGHSNGAAHSFSQIGGKDIRKQFAKENPPAEGRLNHASLADSFANSLALGQANVMAFARDDLFPDSKDIVLDTERLLRSMLGEIKTNSVVYDEVLAAARQVAERNNYCLEDFGIPERPQPKTLNLNPVRGPLFNDEGHTYRLGVDGNLSGISDIYGAACLVDAMSARI